MKKAVKTKAKTKKAAEKIGVLGGSFNPVHTGHLNSALSAIEKFKLKKVIFVPTNVAPHKDMAGPSAQDRADLVRAAISRYTPELEVNTLEIDRGGVSYSVDTLTELAKEYGSKNLYFIMGADAFAKFPTWKDFSKLLHLSNFIVTTRPGSTLSLAKDDLPDGLKEHVKEKKATEIKLKSGLKILALPLEDIEVSATELRKKLRNNQDVKKFIPQAALDLLNERGLYKQTRPLVSDYERFAMTCAQKGLDKKALDLKIYDMAKRSSYADYSLICSATSSRHATSIAEGILEFVKEEIGLNPLSVEGMRDGQWVLIDYGPVVIHVFQDSVRTQYKIEDLWKNCRSYRAEETRP